MNGELLDLIQDTEILDYCMRKEGAYIDHPFGDDCIIVKIGNSRKNRIFAEIFVRDNELKLTVSTDEVTAQKLRRDYPGVIVKGWHCPSVQAKYKSTVAVYGVSQDLIRHLIDISYDRAVSKLK